MILFCVMVAVVVDFIPRFCVTALVRTRILGFNSTTSLIFPKSAIQNLGIKSGIATNIIRGSTVQAVQKLGMQSTVDTTFIKAAKQNVGISKEIART